MNILQLHLFALIFGKEVRSFAPLPRTATTVAHRPPTVTEILLAAPTNMGEFDDDDDDAAFANFDLEGALSSATKRSSTAADAIASPLAVGAASTICAENDDRPNKRSKTTDRRRSGDDDRDSPGGGAADPVGGISRGSDNDGDDGRVPLPFAESVTQTLRAHFGHDSFRPGQLAVLNAVMGGGDGGAPPRDACVFWATGSGKSLCYQIPPLQTKRVALVVSPLVSLMQDQCAKLNGLGDGGEGRQLAAFLGSSQMDPSVESMALDGKFRVVYVTPEKLLGGGGSFLDALGRMHRRGGESEICLMAVDESHCVSEWGHDFRPEYLKIGSEIRSHPILSSIPIIALTATAVPRVQRDILRNLRMRPDAYVAKKSFDRTNLRISIRRKPRDGHSGAFRSLVENLSLAVGDGGRKGKGAAAARSTIVYVPSRRAVDEIAEWIVGSLVHKLVEDRVAVDAGAARAMASALVRPYHAGLSPAARTDAHTDFLIGRAPVIVATVAFGMGIDKPDIRRVVHYGPPKTVEEYYQQMGRAGRDGLAAECVMYCNTADFTNYKSDFYIGKLGEEAKRATVQSMDALRDFAMTTESNRCRRAELLEFFHESPAFGKHCGTCDLCVSRKIYEGDVERDFRWEGALVVILAIMACSGQAMSTIEIVMKGQTIEDYKYSKTASIPKEHLAEEIMALKGKMKKKKPIAYFKELIPELVNRGYVQQDTKINSGHKYARPYAVYILTKKGNDAFEFMHDRSIMLPVPLSIREEEKRDEEKRQKTLSELKDAGVDLEQIPEDELASGTGDAIKALKCWYSYINSLQKSGRTERVDELDDLRSRLDAWRMDMAERHRMAPGAVMQEHLLLKIAYTVASFRHGSRMERDSLIAAGVRSSGIDELTAVLGEWSQETQQDAGVTAGNDSGDSLIHFPGGSAFEPVNSWKFAIYKANKKTGLATWESSYTRFVAGEHPQTIAVTPTNGRPIQIATVAGHIFDALTHGRAVDLKRVSDVTPAPSKNEWEELARCESETGMDVTGDPAISGASGDRFTMKDFLVPIMGNEFALKEYTERTEYEKTSFSRWCELLKWFMALRRTGYQANFGAAEKNEADIEI